MYTLFSYSILVCFVIHLSIVTCFTAGAIKRNSYARRFARSAAAISADDDLDLVPTVDDVTTASSDETNEFLKKSLIEFFSGVKPIKASHDIFARAQKRTLKSHSHKHGHRKSARSGKRRHTVSRIRNDTDTTGSRDGKCKFPFIYDGKTVYQCIEGPSSSSTKKWCSLTSNYDRDLQWTNCLADGSPVRRSENIEELHDEVDQLISVEKEKITNGIRKHETAKVSSKEDDKTDDICETCDKVSKNDTDIAVKNLKDEIDDVEKSDKEIHSLVSKEVDNFIGSVLTKHGVPDTEQKELLALNAKLSTELAQEVSCKLSNESIGNTRSECVNKTLREDKNKQSRNTTTEDNTIKTEIVDSFSNKTVTNQTGGNSDELLSTEVDAFISSVLSQHNISSTKQKDVIKSIKKASTDIADQIDYVVAYAKAGGSTNKIHENPVKQSNTVSTPNSIHAAVDSFLSLVLEKHGVPTDDQKEILDWNAQLSTDIAEQVNSIVEKAKKGKKSHARHNEWKSSQTKQSSPTTDKTETKAGGYIEDHLEETKNKTLEAAAAAEQENNKTINASDIDALQSVYEKGNPSKEHFNKDKSSMDTVRDDDEDTTISNAGSNEASKKYDDVSPENDMETGIGDVKDTVINETSEGIAPEAVDTFAPTTEESISPPSKLQYKGDEEEENMTSFANKEFKKKPQIHFKKKNLSHKKIMGDENLDKYLMEDNWSPRSDKTKESSKSEDVQSENTEKEDGSKDSVGSGEKDLNDDEKTMINYVSDSIIQSVNNVKQITNSKEVEEKESQGKPKDVTYKKLDSGKKPYLIYRVQQRKGGVESLASQPGIDSIDAKSQKIIPGAKNINIIIINNKNNSLDLNDIENTIARSSEPSEDLNETSLDIANITSNLENSGAINKTSENLFLLINTTDKANVSQLIGQTPLAASNGNNETASRTELNVTMNSTTPGNDTISSPLLNQTANENNMTNTTDATKAVNELKTLANSIQPNLFTNISENATTTLGGLFDTVKNNESKPSEETNSYKDNRNMSYSKLLNEYDKELEISTSQSLRKSGLISMNYAPEEVEVKTFGGNANGNKCMFPFIYDGDTYFNCINLNRDKPWCSITANYDKLPVWGFCDNDHPVMSQDKKNNNPSVGEIQAHKQQMLHSQGEELISKHSGVKTYGGNANGAPCVIPFVYDGQTHMKCIPRRDGSAWCAASHSYDIHPVWGFCCDNDVYKC